MCVEGGIENQMSIIDLLSLLSNMSGQTMYILQQYINKNVYRAYILRAQ